MSNKTPKAKDAVTASAPKSLTQSPRPAKSSRRLQTHTVIFLLGVAFAVLSVGIVWYRSTVKVPGSEHRYVEASIKDTEFRLEVADTPVARAKGLGGRSGINLGEGMLFVFDIPDIECFWMKDVNFNIDILWFDADKRLIHVVPDLSPSTYPNTFCPPTTAKYVVELPAGMARTFDINNGDILTVEKL